MIYEDVWVQERGDGKKRRFVATLKLATAKANGKKDGPSKTLKDEEGKTPRNITTARKMAEEWRQEMERKAESEQGLSASDTETTVPDYIEDMTARREKLPEGSKGRLEGSSAETNRSALRAQIRPTFDGVKLTELTSSQVQKWVNEMSESLKPSTVRKYFNVLNSAMNWAAKQDRIIATNPIGSIDLPGEDEKPPTTIPNEDVDKLKAFLSTALAKPEEAAPELVGIRIAMLTGMRQAEICWLAWEQIDFKANTLTIEDSLGRRDGGYYRKPPKSKRSKRKFPMGTALRELLMQRRAVVEAECEGLGIPFSEELHVIGKVDGAFMRPDHLGKKWVALAELLSIKNTDKERATFHELRHTAATTLINSGVDRALAASILGDTVATIDKYYIGIEPEEQLKAMERLG